MTANPLPPVSALGTPSGAAALSAGTSRLKPVDPMRVLRQHLGLFIIATVVGVLLGVAVWGALLFIYPVYRSFAQLQVNPAIENPLGDVVATGGMSSRMDVVEAFMANQVMLLTSESILDAVLAKEAVRATDWGRQFLSDGTFDVSTAREELLDALGASPIRGSTVIQVSFSDRRRAEVQVILQHLLAEYHRTVERLNTTQSASVKGTFSSMLQAADRDLQRLSQQMQKFIEDGGITSLQTSQTDTSITFQEMSRQRAVLEFEAQAAKASYEALAQQAQQESPAPTPEESYIIDQTQAVSLRKEDLRRLRESRAVMLLDVGESHPSVRALDQRGVAIQQELDNERLRALGELRAVKMETALKGFEGKAAELEAMLPKIEAVQVKMIDLNVKLQQYEQLVKRQERSTAERDEIATLLRSVDAMERRDDARRVVTSQAPTEAKLIFPLPEVMVPLVTLLLLTGVGSIVFLREMLDQRVKTPADVKLLTDVEFLGMLPDAQEDPLGHADLSDAVRRDPAGLLAESFRQVRTSVLSRMDRRGYKTLMLVGAQPDCGVSVVTANLAASLAYNGRRVLVLDANFRRPSQHRQFGISDDAPGLADVLQGRATIEKVLLHLEDPAIDVLPAGSAAAGYPEQLEGVAFRNLLATLESRYDMILIDAPPALLTSESSLLAKQVDAMAIVVRAMQQKRGMIDRMMRQYDGHRADVLGVILNGVRSSAGGYFRKSYKAFYDYSRNGNSVAAVGNGRAKASKASRTADRSALADAGKDKNEG